MSLPEAIAALDRCFPCAVACTLDGEAPSLIDLETLQVYLTIGHGSVSLPPIPIWALTARPAYHAKRIGALELPVRLVPRDAGAEALAAEIVHHLGAPARERQIAESENPQVLYLDPDARVGYYLSRYLGSCGIATRSVETRPAAQEALGRVPFRVLVADLLHEGPGMKLLRRIDAHHPLLSVVALGQPGGWLAQLSPREMPRCVTCMLPQPVRAESLVTCLRRLLRLPARRRPPIPSGSTAPPRSRVPRAAPP